MDEKKEIVDHEDFPSVEFAALMFTIFIIAIIAAVSFVVFKSVVH